MDTNKESVAVKEGGRVLVLVDVQNDFHPGGSLAVPNADQDSKRIASLILRSMESGHRSIDRIICTMDSHNTLHIANPGFWISGEEYSSTRGNMVHPSPFTVITSEDVKRKKWIPRPDLKITNDMLNLLGHTHPFHPFVEQYGDKDQNLDLYRWCIYYTEKLEEEEEINLTIWPEHCLIGTEGWCMVKEVRDAVREWEINTGRTAEFICKGHSNLTEMYSAMMAALPVCQYTSFNQHIVSIASRSKQVLMCGQASSHCVNFTTRHLVMALPESDRKKITILTDCMSPVTGSEASTQTFFEDMKAFGAVCMTSVEALLD